MRHVFIINPAAGKKQRALLRIPEIEAYFREKGGQAEDYTIYVTKGKMDAAQYARKIAEEGHPVRFYACGGDGTLMEVLNGVFGCENVELALIPCGSANDFVRSFENPENFTSIRAQVEGTSQTVDAINCNGRISINNCAMGMDADVADKMVYFKHFPLVTGPMAYQLAIVYMFFHHIGRRLHVSIENEQGTTEHDGDYLFSLCASGQYYGGGYRGAPQARMNDGLLDFVLVDTIRRMRVLGFLKKYKAGQHLGMEIVHTFRGQRMTVSSDTPVTVCVDGECFSDYKVTFQLCPHAVRFVVPKGSALAGEPIRADEKECAVV